jgi:hypothetical protein
MSAKQAVLARFPGAGAQYLKPIPEALFELAQGGYWRIYQSVDQAPDTPNVGVGATEAAAWQDAASQVTGLVA